VLAVACSGSERPAPALGGRSPEPTDARTRIVATHVPRLREPTPAPTSEPAQPPEPPTLSGPPAQPRFREPVVERAETRAVVFLYHAFNRGAQRLSVRARDLDGQLTWLEQNHVEVISTSELLGFLEGELALPARVAVLHIDDGLKSVYASAWPVLRQHGARFTVGIPTGMLEEPKNAPVMTWDEVREMVASGLCEVASHGHMHRRLPSLSGRLAREEIDLSRDLITARIGKAPVAFLYPLGAFSPSSAKAVEKAGYPGAFRATGAPIAAGSSSLFWLPRVSIFHGEPAETFSLYYGDRFIGQVRYDKKRDRALHRKAP